MVGSSFTGKAHYTSAKFDNFRLEFDQCVLTEQFFKESKVLCVAESPINFFVIVEEEYLSDEALLSPQQMMEKHLSAEKSAAYKCGPRYCIWQA